MPFNEIQEEEQIVPMSLGEAIRMENDVKVTPGILDVINIVNGADMKALSAEVLAEWKNNPYSKIYNYDIRENTILPWFLSTNIENPMSSENFEHVIRFPLLSKLERHKILDEFYDKKMNMDYRNLDASALCGKDHSEKAPGEKLTESEKDLLKLFVNHSTNQTLKTFANMEPEYFINRYDLLTPKERYLAEINDEYELQTINPTILMVQHRNGYGNTWEPRDKKHYLRDVNNNPLALQLFQAEKADVAQLFYNFRRAMLNGDENVPKLEITFKTNQKWNIPAIKKYANLIAKKKPVPRDDIRKGMTNNVFDLCFGHFVYSLDKQIDSADIYDNIFIDGISATEYTNKYLDEDMHIAEKNSRREAIIIKALFSGKHIVESTLRYMNKDGKMDVAFMKIEPDLSVVAQQERASRSWFRKLFDFGPFKITTCKDKQAERLNKETEAERVKRHKEINDRYHIVDKTTSEPDRMIIPKWELATLRNRDMVFGVEQLAYSDWKEITARAERIKADAENKAEHIRKIINHSEEWTLDRAFMACVDKCGIGNAVDYFSNLDKKDPYLNRSTLTAKTREVYGNIPDDYTPTITRNQAFNKLMDYFFKHGAMENANCSAILEIAENVAENDKQKNFINSLKAINDGRENYDIELQKVAAASLDAKDDQKLNKEQAQTLLKGQVQIKVNSILCNTLIKKLSAKKCFDETFLEGNTAKALLELTNGDNKKYNQLIDSVVEKVDINTYEQMSINEVLTQIHENIKKIPDNVKNGVAAAMGKENDMLQTLELIGHKKLEINNPVNKSSPVTM